MKFIRTILLFSPNKWLSERCAESIIDFSSEIVFENFNKKLSDYFLVITNEMNTTLLIDDKLNPAEIFCTCAIFIQKLCGKNASFSCVRLVKEPDVYRIAVEFDDDVLIRRTFKLLLLIYRSIMNEVTFSAIESIKILQRIHSTPSPILSLENEAKRADIPFFYNIEKNSIILGHGVKQKLIDPCLVDGFLKECAKDYNIPVIAVTGTKGKTTTINLISHILKYSGYKVGTVSTNGVYIDGKRIKKGDCAGYQCAQQVLYHHEVEVAILETAFGGLNRDGLAFNKCDACVITNIHEGDHLSEYNSLADLVFAKSTLVKNVRSSGTAVLNGDDPHTLAMASSCLGNTIFFSRRTDIPLETAVFIDDGCIILRINGMEEKIVDIGDIPIAFKGIAEFQIDNILASIAALYSLKIPIPQIIAGLKHFKGGFDQNPGRFNLCRIKNCLVFIDYAHNISSLRCLTTAIKKFDYNERIAVYSVPGNRRNQDIIEQGNILGDCFDTVYLFEGEYQRGRPDGEILELLKTGAAKGKKVKTIVVEKDYFKAISIAISLLNPGTLLFIQVDEVDSAIEYIKQNYVYQELFDHDLSL